ncbi:MAG: helix-hairpin-helix domain-containing protein, partial [Verrucomicrobiales bacterium]
STLHSPLSTLHSPLSTLHAPAPMKLGLAALILAAGLAASGSDLREIPGCTLISTDWADGDSFRIETPSGEEHTVRLYGVDCLEWHVTDETDARRLRAQRRYFGITEAGGSPAQSIALGKSFGEAAAKETAATLQRPFTLFTAFANARGDGRYQRIYAFVVTSDGKDLAEHLVSCGLARAHGVSRQTYDDRSRDEYRAHLADLELLAARESRGIWSATRWESLAKERRDQRAEDEELGLATQGSPLKPGEAFDPNEAARDELMRLPGIGETLANRIIESRPYAAPGDLGRVEGIGAATLEKILPHLDVPNLGKRTGNEKKRPGG